MSEAPDEPQWDAFISHATEDKSLARPLAHALSALGARVWYDEFSLKLGDSLSREIDRGLSASKFGIVVLSPTFFEKHWPKRELEGLVAKEVGGRGVILPLWHRVGFDDVCKFSPTLANKVAASTEGKTAEQLAMQILSVIRPDIVGNTSYEQLHTKAQSAGLEELRIELGQPTRKRVINPIRVKHEREFEEIQISHPDACEITDIAIVDKGKAFAASLADTHYLLKFHEKLKLSLWAKNPNNHTALHFYNSNDGTFLYKKGNFKDGVAKISASPDGRMLSIAEFNGICSIMDLRSFELREVGRFSSKLSYFNRPKIVWRSDSNQCLFSCAISGESENLLIQDGNSRVFKGVIGNLQESKTRNSWLFVDRDALRETDISFIKPAEEIFVFDRIDKPASTFEMVISPSGSLCAIAQVYNEGTKLFASVTLYQTDDFSPTTRMETFQVARKGIGSVIRWPSEDSIALTTKDGLEIRKLPEFFLTHTISPQKHYKIIKGDEDNYWLWLREYRRESLISVGRL
jgi:hypothetical protein